MPVVTRQVTGRIPSAELHSVPPPAHTKTTHSNIPVGELGQAIRGGGEPCRLSGIYRAPQFGVHLPPHMAHANTGGSSPLLQLGMLDGISESCAGVLHPFLSLF